MVSVLMPLWDDVSDHLVSVLMPLWDDVSDHLWCQSSFHCGMMGLIICVVSPQAVVG